MRQQAERPRRQLECKETEKRQADIDRDARPWRKLPGLVAVHLRPSFRRGDGLSYLVDEIAASLGVADVEEQMADERKAEPAIRPDDIALDISEVESAFLQW